MENGPLDRIIEQLAKKHNTSAETVRNDMEEAIHAAFTTSDPDAREKFQSLFSDREPSLEEFICKMLVELDKRMTDEQIH